MDLKDAISLTLAGCGTISTVAIALLVRWTGLNQHRENRLAGNVQINIQRQQYKLQLLDRRVSIIKRIEVAASLVSVFDDKSLDSLVDFEEAAYEARFLFDDSIGLKIDGVRTTIMNLKMEMMKFERAKSEDVVKRSQDECLRLMNELSENSYSLTQSLRSETRIDTTVERGDIT